MNTPVLRCLRRVAKNQRLDTWPTASLFLPRQHKSSTSPHHQGDHVPLKHDRSPTESRPQPMHAPLGAKTSLQASTAVVKHGSCVLEVDGEAASGTSPQASTATQGRLTSIHVQWPDGATARYLATWLRDHDPQAMHETSQQRQSNSLTMVRCVVYRTVCIQCSVTMAYLPFDGVIFLTI